MQINSPTFFIEINKREYVFAVGDINENNDFKLSYKDSLPLQGINNNKITDYDLVYNTIKKIIYLVEQKLNFTFKETIIILNNFDCSFINITGYKKLNGSQLLKENITYILNSLKSAVNEIEKKKIILHIFNSKYCLDNKKIENLPIGLFGDFYSHELSFCLIDNNDFKNLSNIFTKCYLKIKKILLKSFVEGTYLNSRNQDLETFFNLSINEQYSQISYFENDALKYEQHFNFGSNIVINDISKITSLSKNTVKEILLNLNRTPSDQDLIEKELFKGESYRKIKKTLFLKIAAARIQELSEIMIFKNINFTEYNKKGLTIFLKINDNLNIESLNNIYKSFFSNDNQLIVRFLESIEDEHLMNNANKLVNFGWKKEAVPVIHSKKSIIARFFEIIFG